MGNARRTAVSIGAIVAGVGIMASLSWACTPQAMLSAIQPESGSPGSTVAVSGNHFDSAQVEIRWHTEDGRLLALGSGPDLNTAIRIPDVAPGTYYVVALGRSAADPSQIAGKAVQPFTVTASTTSTPPPTGGGGTTPTGQPTAPGAAPAPTSSPSGTAPAAGSTAPAPSAAADAQPSQNPGTADAPGTAPAAAATTTPASSSAPASAATRPASASKGTVATPERLALPSPLQGPAVGAPASEAIAADADSRRASGRTATGEAWSAFATASPGPGLSGGSTPAPASSGAGPILFFAGLLTLFAAATVALVRQRRLQKA